MRAREQQIRPAADTKNAGMVAVAVESQTARADCRATGIAEGWIDFARTGARLGEAAGDQGAAAADVAAGDGEAIENCGRPGDGERAAGQAEAVVHGGNAV